MELSQADDNPSSSVDDNDVVVTVSETKPPPSAPSEVRLWKHSRCISGTDRPNHHPIVVVPSDSEEDSDDDIAIVSVCPPPPSDNDDCIVESYQPPAETFCAVAADRMLAVPPASDDDPTLDVPCANSALDLQFATYSQTADQPDAFLVHDVPNLGAWILSSESASTVKQPDVNTAQNTCAADSPVLACTSTFGVPATKPRPPPTFTSESVQFNTVQLPNGGILFDMGTAKVSANIDKSSVLSLSAKIQSSDDRHSTTVSFVGSISDHKSPASSDYISVQTGVSQPPEDLNVSLVTVSPVASPDVVSSGKVDSSCQTTSVSLNVNAVVDAALNETVDGLLQQMSCHSDKAPKPDTVPSAGNIKQDRQIDGFETIDCKAVALKRQRCNYLESSGSSSRSCSHVPTSSGSFALSKKRRSRPWKSAGSVKTPRLLSPPHVPSPLAVSSTAAVNAVSLSGRPSSLVDCCCVCDVVAPAQQLSHCLVGHPCCAVCMQNHVKSILTSTAKVPTVFTLAFILIITTIPSPSHSFFPRLKPPFSVNPSHRSLPFLLPG